MVEKKQDMDTNCGLPFLEVPDEWPESLRGLNPLVKMFQCTKNIYTYKISPAPTSLLLQNTKIYKLKNKSEHASVLISNFVEYVNHPLH